MNEGDKMGECQRCRGFMVRDSIYNVDGQFLEIEIGRCLNCGHVVDLTFLKTRQVEKGNIPAKQEEVLV
jgi:hypothetical protein